MTLTDEGGDEDCDLPIQLYLFSLNVILYCIVLYIPLQLFFLAFPCVFVQMPPENACISCCIITLVTLVFFAYTVCFQMSNQMTSPRRCIFALVAFVWPFPSVSV